MRTLAPEHSIRFFEMLQAASYAINIDSTDEEVLVELARQLGHGGQEFADLLGRADLADADYEEADLLGARGYPTLILSNQGDRIPVAAGYTRADQVLRTIGVMG